MARRFHRGSQLGGAQPKSPRPGPRIDAGERFGVGERRLFVGGLHRSGTSLLARLLSSSVGATGLARTGFTEDEGHYLHDAYPSARQLGGPGRFAFDPRAHLTEADVDDAASMASIIDTAWSPYLGDGDAQIKVEKSPQNLIQARLLQTVFPGAGFVMIVRHPAAVALATRKWTGYGLPGTRRLMPKRSLRSLIEHWVVAHELLLEDQPRIHDLQIVRFEDLIADQDAVLGTIRSRYGLGRSESSLRAPERLDPVYRRQWRHWISTPLGTRAVSGWLSEFEATFAAFGYHIDDEF